MADNNAFWQKFLAKTEEHKGKPRRQLIAELQRSQERSRQANIEQAAALVEMRAIVGEAEQMVKSGRCEQSFYESLARGLRASESALAASEDTMKRMAILVQKLSRAPEARH